MKSIKNLKLQSEGKKDLQDRNKSFSLLTCKKDEFKEWFDPL